MDRINRRGHKEKYFVGKHLRFCEIKYQILNNYLSTYPPRFPCPTEFHVSELRHDTNFSGLQAILSDPGFKDPGTGTNASQGLVWWSLAITGNGIADAERRFLLQKGVDNGCKPFLYKFTSSPAFRKASRLGNFRFTFPITELLESYADQFCQGRAPQMRIYETVVYKQEVMYAVVVHAPDVQKEFKKYPLLEDCSTAPCSFQDGKIVWRPQGLSKTHAFRLAPASKTLVKKVPRKKRKFCMWDHVVLAFHVPQDKIFRFEKETLVKHLSLCQGTLPNLNTEGFIKCEFEANSDHQ
ncbi:uncharacterized protein si:ch211-197h24.8 [Electrophorus electricus]|uniref:uncharacterized protein si:ch211-197h24.8 n=1 Tax=Electrophorus electricus TaxID=8005 RepID=UPI0015CF9CC5|nr:uncharacterized protein si:ch211-197h24.8 [Electrophorus electricus]